MTERTELSCTIHAFSLIIQMIGEDLEKNGVFSRRAFGERLAKMIDEADADRPTGEMRLDLEIGRLVAEGMIGPKKKAPWRPSVIEGGRQENDEGGSK